MQGCIWPTDFVRKSRRTAGRVLGPGQKRTAGSVNVKRQGIQGWRLRALAVAMGAGAAGARAQIPQSLRSDHAEMQAELLKWLGTPSAVGLTAGHLSNALIEHFAAEDEAVFPILGLLYTLAS